MSKSPENKKYFFLLVLIVCINAGCTTTSVSLLRERGFKNNNGIVIDVPFVKQAENLCGPAALEAVFAYWGKSHNQKKIAECVFQQELRGVLNIDLVKYARDQGVWAKGYVGDFNTLKERLLSGVPIIVLEKLHPFILNRRHYTVVVGFSEEDKLIIEHTGTRDFVLRNYNGFKRNWYAGGNWMLEIVPFDKINYVLNKEDSIELGTVLEKNGLFDQALERYNYALALDPENALILFNIGNVYLDSGDLDKAEEAYKKAIAQKKDFAAALNNLAYLYMKKKDYSLALEYINQALEIKSDKRFYHLDTKAQILFKQGKIKEAVRAFKEAKACQKGVPTKTLKDFYRFWNERL